MPFTTTNTVPKIDATVTVKITGLMLLKSGAGNTCDVGVHRLSALHTFQATLIVNTPGLPLSVIRLFTGALTAPFNIDLVPAPDSGFQLFAQEPFVRNGQGSHPFDYRWAINMRKVNPAADYTDDAKPEVTLNAGILYSSSLSRPTLQPVLVAATASRSEQPKPLHKFAADLAVAIDVPDGSGSSVVVRWEESKQQRILTLPRDIDDAGTTYTISLANDPPTPAATPHDEFTLYYDVLEEGGAPIPPERRFRLQVPAGVAPGSDAIPCMPVTLDP